MSALKRWALCNLEGYSWYGWYIISHRIHINITIIYIHLHSYHTNQPNVGYNLIVPYRSYIGVLIWSGPCEPSYRCKKSQQKMTKKFLGVELLFLGIPNFKFVWEKSLIQKTIEKTTRNMKTWPEISFFRFWVANNRLRKWFLTTLEGWEIHGEPHRGHEQKNPAGCWKFNEIYWSCLIGLKNLPLKTNVSA